LNRHSRLLGNDPDSVQVQQERGQRAFCSNRGRRGGCGRTVSIFLAGVLPRHSVPSWLLTQLLTDLLGGASVQAAAQSFGGVFALETVYRIRQRVRCRLGGVRVCLCREAKPPACALADPLLQTVRHLQAVFGAAVDLVAAFQLRFQCAFLG